MVNAATTTGSGIKQQTVLTKALAVECQPRERRDNVRVAQEPDIQEKDRPEQRGLDHDRCARGERPTGDHHDQREIELRVTEPSQGRRRARWAKERRGYRSRWPWALYRYLW